MLDFSRRLAGLVRWPTTGGSAGFRTQQSRRSRMSSRGTIVVLALSIAGAIGLAPHPTQRSLAQAPRTAHVRVAGRAEVLLDAVAVRRDPFTEPTAPAVLSATVPARTPPGETIEPLPSNLVNDTIPALPGAAADPAASGPRVSAIVTGPHPYAMLDTGGVHEIRGLGDRVGGIPIVAIDLNGVRLRDGERLMVDPAARP
jgi:hypothetical protein